MEKYIPTADKGTIDVLEGIKAHQAEVKNIEGSFYGEDESRVLQELDSIREELTHAYLEDN